MKHPFRIALLAGALLLAAGSIVVLKHGPTAEAATLPSAADKAALTVQLAQPQRVDWPRSLQLNGALAAWQEASISAETGGLRITALHADIGSRVRRGQLLAELASDTVQAELRQAEASVAQARASLLEAQANARRGQAVKDSGALSSQQIEQYQIAAQSAAASLASAEAARSSARIKLAQTRIVAVDDGIITSRSATLGAVLSSGSELFRLLRQGRLEWRAEASAQQLAQLKPGQAATITLPSGETVDGRLRQLAPTLASDTRTALAYIDLPGQSAARAGMYVRGRVELGRAAALALPASAITVRDGHSYVFEVDAQQKVIQRKVTTGRSQDQQTEILAGLAASAQVVRSGGAFLNDGDTVRLAPAGKEAA